MSRKNQIELYHKFRQELDALCIPKIIDNEMVKEIVYNNKVVGIICGMVDYIDCVYVLPEYRRKGFAKKAVLDWCEGNYAYGIRLHIINNNEPAKKFWNSVFELKKIGGNEIDTMYEIVRCKE